MTELLTVNSFPIFLKKLNLNMTKEELNYINSLHLTFQESGVATSDDSFIFNNKELFKIKDIFNEAVNEYKENILQIENEIYLTQSWIATSQKNAYHHEHIHYNSFLACVYYLQCESGKFIIDFGRSPIEQGFHFGFKIKKYNIFNSAQSFIEVKTGDLLIFPGWLRHKTSKNLSDTNRAIIGANYFVKGEFGNKNNYDYLKI